MKVKHLKEVVVLDGNKTMSVVKYKRSLKGSEPRREDLETRFEEGEGKVKGKTIEKYMGMCEGEVFKWDEEVWRRIEGNGCFEHLKARVRDEGGGEVGVEVVAVERPRRNLEYGVTKSLYTGEWEGEVRRVLLRGFSFFLSFFERLFTNENRTKTNVLPLF